MDCDFGGPEESAAFRADLHAVYVDYFIPHSESTSDLSEVGSEALSEHDENESESRSSRSRPSLVVFEETEVREFVSNTCGCNKLNSGPCSKYFTEDSAEEVRSRMLELSRDELDLVVLAQISALSCSGELHGNTHGSKKKKVNGRETILILDFGDN